VTTLNDLLLSPRGPDCICICCSCCASGMYGSRTWSLAGMCGSSALPSGREGTDGCACDRSPLCGAVCRPDGCCISTLDIARSDALGSISGCAGIDGAELARRRVVLSCKRNQVMSRESDSLSNQWCCKPQEERWQLTLILIATNPANTPECCRSKAPAAMGCPTLPAGAAAAGSPAAAASAQGRRGRRRAAATAAAAAAGIAAGWAPMRGGLSCLTGISWGAGLAAVPGVERRRNSASGCCSSRKKTVLLSAVCLLITTADFVQEPVSSIQYAWRHGVASGENPCRYQTMIRRGNSALKCDVVHRPAGTLPVVGVAQGGREVADQQAAAAAAETLAWAPVLAAPGKRLAAAPARMSCILSDNRLQKAGWTKLNSLSHICHGVVSAELKYAPVRWMVGDYYPMAVTAALATGCSGPCVAAAEEGSRLRGQVDAAASVALRQALTAAGGACYQAAQLASRGVAAVLAAGAKSLCAWPGTTVSSHQHVDWWML
jgi:hypothetical protein